MAPVNIPNQLESLVILTGMSGSGKHTAFKALEDLGYFCVDNLPISLISRLVEMSTASGGEIRQLAVVIDIRLGESLTGFEALFSRIKQLSARSTVVFFDASNEVLARRYGETRRVHPLGRKQSLLEGIRSERKKLSGIRSVADRIVDTSEFSVHDFRNLIYQEFQPAGPVDPLNVSLVSFGFKHGLPYNSELVFDVRFLPNPFFEAGLREKTGNDVEVVQYMLKQPETGEILGKLYDMLEYLLPKYTREGKKYITISVGCTGGKHRSVMLVNELKKRLERVGRKVNLVHRDLHNE
ncbi:MAG: RNase adapter RapZ [Acidobacteriota bacterium]